MPVLAGAFYFITCLLGIVPMEPRATLEWRPCGSNADVDQQQPRSPQRDTDGAPRAQLTRSQCVCNLFNVGGIANCCVCLVGDNFLAGTHKSYYVSRGSYAGSFTTAVPVVGPFVYLALKVSRQLLVAVPPGVRFAEERVATRFNCYAILRRLAVPALCTTGIAATAFLFPAGLDWTTELQRLLYHRFGVTQSINDQVWAAVCTALVLSVLAAMVLACGTTAVVERMCLRTRPSRGGGNPHSAANAGTNRDSANTRLLTGRDEHGRTTSIGPGGKEHPSVNSVRGGGGDFGAAQRAATLAQFGVRASPGHVSAV